MIERQSNQLAAVAHSLKYVLFQRYVWRLKGKQCQVAQHYAASTVQYELYSHFKMGSNNSGNHLLNTYGLSCYSKEARHIASLSVDNYITTWITF